MERIKLNIDSPMAPRFNYYWKQPVPTTVGNSDVEASSSQLHYRSLFNTIPFYEKSPWAQEDLKMKEHSNLQASSPENEPPLSEKW